MFKTLVLGSVFLAAAIADPVLPLRNSALAQETFIQDVSVPYPHQGFGLKSYVSPYTARDTYYSQDGYQAILVPSGSGVHPAEVGFTALSVLYAIISYPFVIAKKVILLLIANLPALLIGVTFTFGLCKLTPICHKLTHWKSIEEAEIEIRSLATPERIARATDFVHKAFTKFSALQNSGSKK